MKLVASSTPGAVDHWNNVQLLAERAILTRLVCRELMERRDEKFSFWRTDAAMQLLSQWKASNIPKGASAWISMDAESQGYSVEARELLAEISAGERVCEALSMLKSADNDREWRDDMQRLNQELKKYWQDHEIATFPPTVKS